MHAVPAAARHARLPHSRVWRVLARRAARCPRQTRTVVSSLRRAVVTARSGGRPLSLPLYLVCDALYARSACCSARTPGVMQLAVPVEMCGPILATPAALDGLLTVVAGACVDVVRVSEQVAAKPYRADLNRTALAKYSLLRKAITKKVQSTGVVAKKSRRAVKA